MSILAAFFTVNILAPYFCFLILIWYVFLGEFYCFSGLQGYPERNLAQISWMDPSREHLLPAVLNLVGILFDTFILVNMLPKAGIIRKLTGAELWSLLETFGNEFLINKASADLVARLWTVPTCLSWFPCCKFSRYRMFLVCFHPRSMGKKCGDPGVTRREGFLPRRKNQLYNLYLKDGYGE